MKAIIYKSILIIFLFSLMSCLEDDHFGESSQGFITEFEVAGQVGDTEIDTDALTIKVTVIGNKDAVLVKKMKISSFATSEIGFGSTLNLNANAKIIVVAEDGTEVLWLVNP